MTIDFEHDINLQRRHLPRILKLNPPLFMFIRNLVIHEYL